jgi:hypothetical protein
MMVYIPCIQCIQCIQCIHVYMYTMYTMEALLTQANVALMEQPLPAREVEVWRSQQAKYARHHHADAFVEFVEDREEWALENIAYSTTPSVSGSAPASSGTLKSYERKEARVMTIKATGKGEVHFPPPRNTHGAGPASWMSAGKNMPPQHVPYSRGKIPEERLAIVRKR